MKRSFIIVALIMIIGFAAGISAQTAGAPAAGGENLYIKTMYISRIYPHSLGYKVNYWTGDGKLMTTFIPLAWFKGTAGKGEIASQYNRAVPYMEIVYSSGKFKFIRLHVSPTYNDPSWGAVGAGEDLSDKFKADTLDLAY